MGYYSIVVWIPTEKGEAGNVRKDAENGKKLYNPFQSI